MKKWNALRGNVKNTGVMIQNLLAPSLRMAKIRELTKKRKKKIVSLRREWQKYVNYDKKTMKKITHIGTNAKNTGVNHKKREKNRAPSARMAKLREF